MTIRKKQLYEKQIEDIMYEIGMHFSDTGIGELIEIKEKLIRGHVIMTHSYLENLMTEKINRFYFKMGNSSLTHKINNDPRIRMFNHKIMEKLNFKGKLDIIKDLGIIQQSTYDLIDKINSLRNSLAHIFDFDQSSKHGQDGTIKYKNNDIFGVNGIKVYNHDLNTVLPDLS